eukprot:30944-Pelagococcus_subviridis.AAC.5
MILPTTRYGAYAWANLLRRHERVLNRVLHPARVGAPPPEPIPRGAPRVIRRPCAAAAVSGPKLAEPRVLLARPVRRTPLHAHDDGVALLPFHAHELDVDARVLVAVLIARAPAEVCVETLQRLRRGGPRRAVPRVRDDAPAAPRDRAR